MPIAPEAIADLEPGDVLIAVELAIVDRHGRRATPNRWLAEQAGISVYALRRRMERLRASYFTPPRACGTCGCALPRTATRRRLYCGDACRMATFRSRRTETD